MGHELLCEGYHFSERGGRLVQVELAQSHHDRIVLAAGDSPAEGATGRGVEKGELVQVGVLGNV
ncbi:Uncharacterised protein [Mycobacteroides abscessus subsp. abscessus]|nr:Uncharacterised protein [Mycobacteroides abscessus subsp. abscessus]